MFLLFFVDWIVAAIALICRTSRDLAAPDDQLPSNASRSAAWAGLGIGIVLLGGLIFWGIAATLEDARPHGEYGTISGIPISRADYDACGGHIPQGCPGGLTGIINKYESMRRQRG